MLNARIRKRWRQGGLSVALIGEKADLTYPYEYLGAGPQTLKEVVDGKHSFANVLRDAKRPMVIVGSGAVARADGAAVLAAAAQAGAAGRPRQGRAAGTPSTCCTRRPRAWPGSISASCRASAGSTSPAC